MTSIIKVDTLQDTGGNTILSSNGTGNVITSKVNYPAFEAYLSANQTTTHATNTKIQYDTKIFDTHNMYDNSTNYRFTPTIAGKYFVYSCVMVSNTSNVLEKTRNIIFKNGSEYKRLDHDVGSSGTAEAIVVTNNAIIDFNGSSDYVEIFTLVFGASGTNNIQGSSTYKYNSFGAYRIGD